MGYPPRIFNHGTIISHIFLKENRQGLLFLTIKQQNRINLKTGNTDNKKKLAHLGARKTVKNKEENSNFDKRAENYDICLKFH